MQKILARQRGALPCPCRVSAPGDSLWRASISARYGAFFRSRTAKNFLKIFLALPSRLGILVGVTTKMPFPMRNKMAVPSQLERVTIQWQPVVAGGTANRRVTDDDSKFKDRTGGRSVAQDMAENPNPRTMVGQTGLSARMPRCGCSDGNRRNHAPGLQGRQTRFDHHVCGLSE